MRGSEKLKNFSSEKSGTRQVEKNEEKKKFLRKKKSNKKIKRKKNECILSRERTSKNRWMVDADDDEL